MSENNQSGRTPERDKAIFTTSMRDYIDGKRDDNPAGWEYKIRQRVIGSLKDLQRFSWLDKEDRRKIFNSNWDMERDGFKENPLSDDTNKPMTTKLLLDEGHFGLYLAFMSFFEFYYLMMKENTNVPILPAIQHAIEKSERKALKDTEGHTFDVDATVEIDSRKRVDSDEALKDAKERYEKEGLSAITHQEFIALQEADHLEVVRKE